MNYLWKKEEADELVKEANEAFNFSIDFLIELDPPTDEDQEKILSRELNDFKDKNEKSGVCPFAKQMNTSPTTPKSSTGECPIHKIKPFQSKIIILSVFFFAFLAIFLAKLFL